MDAKYKIALKAIGDDMGFLRGDPDQRAFCAGVQTAIRSLAESGIIPEWFLDDVLGEVMRARRG
jgi:hypothetical protein